MIVVPTGRRYTSTITGWVWRPIRCEQCGCEFAYRLQIVARGQGHSPLYLNNQGAQQTAQNRARANFEQKAKKDIAAVNCPQCNHLQSNMVNLLKKRRWRLVIGIAVALVIALYFAFWPKNEFDQ